VKPSEVEEAFGGNGAMDTVLKARDQGKVRYIGFSAHTTKSALDAMKTFKFDTVMFPINFVEFYVRNFGAEVLDLAATQGAGVLAIKPLSWGTWPKDGKKNREWWYRSVEEPAEVELAMRFSLSQKGVVAGIPTSFVDLFEKAVEAARAFKPLDADAVSQLRQMAANRESLFLNEEKQVAFNHPHSNPHYPHESSMA
jgi:predicted aldo/keto reductase-like oxidoreductase